MTFNGDPSPLIPAIRDSGSSEGRAGFSEVKKLVFVKLLLGGHHEQGSQL